MMRLPLRSRRALLTALPGAVAALFLSRVSLAMAPADEAPNERMATLPGTESLVGKRLRVVKPNMAMTMDYSEERVNVEVDDNGNIKRFFIG